MTLQSTANPAAAFALFAVILSLGTARAQTPQSVLQRYLSWRGGAAFAKLDAISETGTFHDGGLTGEATRYGALDGRMRAQSRFGPFSTTLQVTPSSGDYTDLSGQRLPLSRLETGYARADAALLLPLSPSPRVHVSLKAAENVGSKSAEVVEFDRGAAGVYDYLIAPRTGALIGIRIRRNGSESTQTYSDWRTVEGVRMPFHVHDEGHAGLGALQSDTTDFIVDHVRLNPSPATVNLGPLANRHVVRLPPNTSSSDWIPFRLDDGAIFLEIVVDGHPVRALLDSGASQTAIDKGFAATHGITALGRFLVDGQGGTTFTAYTPAVSIRAGDAMLDGVVANVIDFQQPGTRMSPPLIAILGAEAFAETEVDIDYAHHRLRFLRPPIASRLDRAVTLPLGLFEGSFDFPISIEKQPPVPFLLDTGNNGALQIFPAYWQAHAMLQARPSKESGNGGVGGEARFRLATVSSINIGTIEIRDVPTAFETPGNPVSNETGLLGNCGDAILDRFHLLVDFPDRKISFSKY